MNLKLDLINWLDGLRAGKSHQFLIDRRSAWTGYRAECLLREYGILVWGRYAGGGKESEIVGFSVPIHQADWAEYVLLRAKVPLVSPLFNQKHGRLLDAQRQADKPTGGYGRKSKAIGRVMDGLSALTGFSGDNSLQKVSYRRAKTVNRATGKQQAKRSTLLSKVMGALDFLLD